MNIVRAEIVGTREAEEGSGGYTTNYTSYSVLVFYDNGQVELVEGRANSINGLLRYIRPQNDASQMQRLLDQFEEKLKQDFNKIIESNIEKVYNAAYPIPQVKGKTYAEAKDELEKSGFIVELKNPRHKPDPGDLVETCFRKLETMRNVLLRLIPNTRGLSLEDTVKKLSDGIFKVETKPKYIPEMNDRQVIEILFTNDSDYDITVTYNDLSLISAESAEDGFITIIEDKNSVAEIFEIWESHNLAPRYKNLDLYIKMKLDAEKKEGRLKNLDQIKEAIVQLLKKETGK